MKKLRAWLTWKRYWQIQGSILFLLGMSKWLLPGGGFDEAFVYLLGAWIFFGLAECKSNERKPD